MFLKLDQFDDEKKRSESTEIDENSENRKSHSEKMDQGEISKDISVLSVSISDAIYEKVTCSENCWERGPLF